MLTKKCSKCGMELPLHDFSRFTRSRDGRRPECKACQSAAKRLYYQNGGKAVSQAYYFRNRDHILAYNQANRHKYQRRRLYDPAKGPARSAVWRALKTGTLVRPKRCQKCNARCKPEAHHGRGYDPEHYLDVDWLCNACHNLVDHPEFAKLVEGETTCTRILSSSATLAATRS